MRSVFLAIFFVAFSVGTMAQQQSIFKAEKSSTVYSNFSQDNNKAVVDSLHYDAANASSIGFDGPGNFGVYSYWPTESIAAYDGMVVSQLKVYIPQPDNLASAQLEIHHDQTSGAIYTQEFTPVVGWNAIDLTNPMPISSTQDFYIGYYMEATAGFPAGCDAGPVAANGNGNWIYDGTWAHLNDLASTLTGNWNIRAIVSETAGLDLSVKTLELGGITTETEHEIAGAVQNLGATEITSFDVSYSVAGGEETTLNIADVAIAAWGTYEFAFPEL
ncbi:MAG: hypothetical protein PF489_10955 [Salinivirgaceae bacterium]|jgi:hypothetical protein|nr:hypothetical protein [Salinivirgaceae bacterium]